MIKLDNKQEEIQLSSLAYNNDSNKLRNKKTKILSLIIITISIIIVVVTVSLHYGLKKKKTSNSIHISLQVNTTNNSTVYDNKIHESNIAEDLVSFQCPHCGYTYHVNPNEFNCHIYRCGFVDINNDSHLTQINPHESEATIMNYINNGLIKEGCGYPFKIIPINQRLHWSQKEIVKCGFDE